MFGDNLMDIGFQQGYRQMAESLNEFLASQGFTALFEAQEKCPLVLLIGFSMAFSLIATTFMFPCVQYASMYLDAAMGETEAASPLQKTVRRDLLNDNYNLDHLDLSSNLLHTIHRPTLLLPSCEHPSAGYDSAYPPSTRRSPSGAGHPLGSASCLLRQSTSAGLPKPSSQQNHRVE